jgi:GT2 family glycosyltransferase
MSKNTTRAESLASSTVQLVSVIVSTYNWPQALAVVLDSLTLQRDKRFEVIVADDGSTGETADLIAKKSPGFPVRLEHVWQEDVGFRAAAARNMAVSESRGDYLLFLDGDCAVFPDFVATHIRLAERGWFVAGNRILLNHAFTAMVLTQAVPFYGWSVASFIRARLNGSLNRILPLLRLPDGAFRKCRPGRWQGAKTCNIGIWRDDFYRINGFDESFVGWGHEDADLVIRLLNSGVRCKDGRFAVTVLHLWHQEQKRTREDENMLRLLAHIERKAVRAANGVDKYSNNIGRSYA